VLVISVVFRRRAGGGGVPSRLQGAAVGAASGGFNIHVLRRSSVDIIERDDGSPIEQ